MGSSHSASADVATGRVRIDVVAEYLGVPVSLVKRRVECGDIPSEAEDCDGTTMYFVKWSDMGIAPPEGKISELDPPVGEKDPEFVEEDPWGGLAGMTFTREREEDENDSPASAAVEPAVEPPSLFDEVLARQSLIADKEKTIAIEVFPEKETDSSSSEPVLSAPEAESAEAFIGDGADVAVAELEAESGSMPLVSLTGSRSPSHIAEVESTSDLAAAEMMRSEVSSMQLDAREIVSGLLDRWEHTLEQRIYSEQRQRFEMELMSRQNTIKTLQLELQTMHAQHAAEIAQKERLIAERERQIADCERELRDLHESTQKRKRWPFSG